MDCNLPGFSVHGILQARVLGWVAISFSGDLPDLQIEPGSPILQAEALPSEPPRKPRTQYNWQLIYCSQFYIANQQIHLALSIKLIKHIRNTEILLVMVFPSMLIEEIPGRAIIQAGKERELYQKKRGHTVYFTEFKYMVFEVGLYHIRS